MFGDHGFGMGWTMLGWLLIWFVLGVVVWVVVRAIGGGRGSAPDDSPEAILKRRYARGEIDRDEYDQRLRDVRR